MSTHLPEADVEATPAASDAQIKRVRDLAEKAVRLDADIAEASKALAKLGEERTAIVECDLVNAMVEARLETWPMGGGLAFELALVVGASIPKDRQDEAFERLEKDGHGDLIKRKFTIQFGRDDLTWAKKFYNDCMKRKKPLNIEQKTWIEPQTFGAFVREQLKEAAAQGKDPEDLAPSLLYGVYKKTYAKLVAPKAAKPRAVSARVK
jgi:hypothetical protein